MPGLPELIQPAGVQNRYLLAASKEFLATNRSAVARFGNSTRLGVFMT